MKAAPINITYQGDLKCDVEHIPSTTRLRTTASDELGGQEKSLSPVDLLVAAVGSSVLSTMAVAAEKRELDIAGAKVQVDKQLANGCIDGINFRVIVPKRLLPDDKEFLEESARTCPCCGNLHPDIDTSVSFTYVGA